MRNSKRPRNKLPDQTTGEAQGRLGPTLIAHTVVEAQSWTGPLPSPAALEEFRAVVPDAPERIIKQWENESAHRRAYELRSLKGVLRAEYVSRIAAALFALGALAVVGYALHMNQPWIAGILGGGTIASVVWAFMYSRRSDK